MKSRRDFIGMLPLRVMAPSSTVEVVGSLEIELEISGGEEVQEHAFMPSLVLQRNRWTLYNGM